MGQAKWPPRRSICRHGSVPLSSPALDPTQPDQSPTMEEKEGRKSRRAKHRDSALAAQGRSASEADETSSSSHLSSIFSLIEPVTDSKVSSCSDNKDTGKRVPRGETSIDLGAINLALGQTVSGEGSPNVESSHGGFPKFLNEARITHRRSCSNFSAYSTSSKDKTAEERIAEWRNSRDTSSVSNTPPSSMAMQRQSSQTGLNQQQNQPPSPNPQGPSNGVAPAMNGMAAGGLLVHAGQQMDINYIHTKLAELSEQHRANRAQTQQLIASTEQLAVRFFFKRIYGMHALTIGDAETRYFLECATESTGS